MNETNAAPSMPLQSALPRIVTVGRHRIGRVLERMGPAVAGQVRVGHVSAAFDEAVQAVCALHATEPVDALVAAGASGAWVRERVDIPVAMVEVRGFDLLQALASARAMAQARSAADTPRIGLVSFGQPSPQLARFDALFGSGIVQFSYHGPEDAPACVRALQKAGVGAVVAPGLVADLAEQAGIPSVLLYSDAAVLQALHDAVLLARHRHAERARHQRLETVLGQLQDGVVAVDTRGAIQALNPAMAALLGAPAQALHGRLLDEVAPALGMAQVLRSPGLEPEGSEDVVQLALRTLAVRRAPILENGQFTGALLVCRDPAAIQRADRHLRANRSLRGAGVRWRIEDYAGYSVAARRVRRFARQFAASDATVLIQGESGTGKELLAQGMHRASRRAAQPFLAVNCAALGESLLESELFGYDEGAFTGARRGGKTGLVEAAHTGTLFLDEIGDMPLALQSRLLRVLQEREVLRVGATTPVPVDLRVIAATHADLAQLVERGAFRRDLYYRLAVLRLSVPALRERGAGDVQALAQRMLAQRLHALHQHALRQHCSAASQADALRLQRLLSVLLEHAAGYGWPGNARELDNWVERLLACRDDLDDGLCDGAGPAGVQPWLEVFPECRPRAPDTSATAGRPAMLRDARREAERRRVREVLQEVQGDQRRACEILGISRATLWRRLRAQD
ncbi:propionate catabolism operon regulatory protein PrpR [Delftia sp. PS-11]|uniref:propionate catabolism operon regulatory protein PrpR n=1 Tax=Delftia sp. PS-11 TaxID=2767222 RepID=UPI0024539640|nr:propionate catabolism operon regulatory protein PrpR [Delftia sp. PS-11]KAJ8740750.1 propionate catabolism operon regulatory protein PrpR [Delftia sp. PS-11]